MPKLYMLQKKLYRYTTNGEGVFSAGKGSSKELIEEVLENKKWLNKPKLKEGSTDFI